MALRWQLQAFKCTTEGRLTGWVMDSLSSRVFFGWAVWTGLGIRGIGSVHVKKLGTVQGVEIPPEGTQFTLQKRGILHEI